MSGRGEVEWGPGGMEQGKLQSGCNVREKNTFLGKGSFPITCSLDIYQGEISLWWGYKEMHSELPVDILAVKMASQSCLIFN